MPVPSTERYPQISGRDANLKNSESGSMDCVPAADSVSEPQGGYENAKPAFSLFKGGGDSEDELVLRPGFSIMKVGVSSEDEAFFRRRGEISEAIGPLFRFWMDMFENKK